MLVVVRHAESEPRVVGGPSEETRPLTERGHGQAEALADRLVATGAVSVVSSPDRRAHDTVAPAAAALGVAITMRDDTREWDDGFETTNNWRPRYEACWRDLDLRYGDGESHRDLMVRAAACLRELLDRAGDGTIVVASHGTWISRGLQALGAPVTLAFWEAMPLPAVFELQADGGAIEMTGPGLP